MSDYSDMSRSSLIIEINRLVRDARNDAIAYKAVIERQEELRESLRQLMAENESLRADAERYRWMRDEAIDPGAVIDKKVGISEIGGFPIWEYRCGTELDDAIDAAISSPENPS